MAAYSSFTLTGVQVQTEAEVKEPPQLQNPAQLTTNNPLYDPAIDMMLPASSGHRLPAVTKAPDTWLYDNPCYDMANSPVSTLPSTPTSAPPSPLPSPPWAHGNASPAARRRASSASDCSSTPDSHATTLSTGCLTHRSSCASSCMHELEHEPVGSGSITASDFLDFNQLTYSPKDYSSFGGMQHKAGSVHTTTSHTQHNCNASGAIVARSNASVCNVEQHSMHADQAATPGPLCLDAIYEATVEEAEQYIRVQELLICKHIEKHKTHNAPLKSSASASDRIAEIHNPTSSSDSTFTTGDSSIADVIIHCSNFGPSSTFQAARNVLESDPCLQAVVTSAGRKGKLLHIGNKAIRVIRVHKQDLWSSLDQALIATALTISKTALPAEAIHIDAADQGIHGPNQYLLMTQTSWANAGNVVQYGKMIAGQSHISESKRLYTGLLLVRGMADAVAELHSLGVAHGSIQQSQFVVLGDCATTVKLCIGPSTMLFDTDAVDTAASQQPAIHAAVAEDVYALGVSAVKQLLLMKDPEASGGADDAAVHDILKQMDEGNMLGWDPLYAGLFLWICNNMCCHELRRCLGASKLAEFVKVLLQCL